MCPKTIRIFINSDAFDNYRVAFRDNRPAATILNELLNTAVNTKLTKELEELRRGNTNANTARPTY